MAGVLLDLRTKWSAAPAPAAGFVPVVTGSQKRSREADELEPVAQAVKRPSALRYAPVCDGTMPDNVMPDSSKSRNLHEPEHIKEKCAGSSPNLLCSAAKPAKGSRLQVS